MPAGPWEIRYAGFDGSGTTASQPPGRASLAEKLPSSIGAVVDSEGSAMGQSELELTQPAAKPQRLPVETIASLAFPFTGTHDPGLTLCNVRLLDDGWAGLSGSAADTGLGAEGVLGDGVITASVGLKPQAISTLGRRYSFYSPEMNLLAETELKTTSGAPAILYEYVWFNGHPVAQVDAGTTTHWTFTDHLGTPLIQTDDSGAVYWRAEHEPYGSVFALRTADQHQPLRLPGQEAEQLNLGPNGATERSYNIFRWYRPSWGRYTQADPLRWLYSLMNDPQRFEGAVNSYRYALSSPTSYVDPLGLLVQLYCAPVGFGGTNLLHRFTGWIGYKHCFVRIKCDCPPSGPYDLRLEVTGPDRSRPGMAEIPAEPRTFRYGEGSIVPISPADNDSSNCKNEDCLLNSYIQMLFAGYPYGENPLAGPNSNTFAHTLLGGCGFQAYWPPGVAPIEPLPFPGWPRD